MPMKKHKPVTLFCYEPEGREFESSGRTTLTPLPFCYHEQKLCGKHILHVLISCNLQFVNQSDAPSPVGRLVALYVGAQRGVSAFHSFSGFNYVCW